MASNFRPGSKVVLKVGQGTFPGKIVSIDEDNEKAVVAYGEGDDEKQVTRRLDKLKAA